MTFQPPDYSQQLLEAYAEQARQMARITLAANGIDLDNPRTIRVEVPRSPEWITARAQFAARWHALTRQGLEDGYLEYGHCYECGGEIEVTETESTWERRPNPDFDPDRPNPYALPADQTTVTIPVRSENP